MYTFVNLRMCTHVCVHLTELSLQSQVAAPRRHVKKHLFSDTDTDAMMEISWLKESSRKPKPKVIDYSRQPRLHPPAPNTTCTLTRYVT